MISRRALLILTARAPAIFSEQARTEGEHRTLAHIPGGTLLGWAAGRGRYDRWLRLEDGNKTETVFHSGKVRFSDALPLANDGAPAYPIAQLLMEPKHARGDAKKLDPKSVRVGRGDEGKIVQYEAMKNKFVTRAGALVKPEQGGRLRTATHEGRADEGKLFGYQHIEPASLRYAASIEADGGALDDAQWNALLDDFRDKTLYLGRSANTGYGGAYACEVHDSQGEELWPAGSVAPGAKRVRVWALSDLALVDEFGAPSLVLRPEQIGLRSGWTYCDADSAISVRRYAPWNGALPGRDVERTVVSAGSVFSFTAESGEVGRLNCIVGMWREAGLGRIWISPPLLDATSSDPKPGAPPKVDDQESVLIGATAGAPASTARVPASPAWFEALVALDATQALGEPR